MSGSMMEWAESTRWPAQRASRSPVRPWRSWGSRRHRQAFGNASCFASARIWRWLARASVSSASSARRLRWAEYFPRRVLFFREHF
ncbi:hypothetical protein [Lysobacter gummosus]|uniref:hypothetical protein n=1 Tax=Lysobacter gummosus TaxID=262324 RepID=UPI003642FFE0